MCCVCVGEDDDAFCDEEGEEEEDDMCVWRGRGRWKEVGCDDDDVNDSMETTKKKTKEKAIILFDAMFCRCSDTFDSMATMAFFSSPKFNKKNK